MGVKQKVRKTSELLGRGVGKEASVLMRMEREQIWGSVGRREGEPLSLFQGQGRGKQGKGKRDGHYGQFGLRLWIGSPLTFFGNLDKAVNCFQIILNIGQFYLFFSLMFNNASGVLSVLALGKRKVSQRPVKPTEASTWEAPLHCVRAAQPERPGRTLAVNVTHYPKALQKSVWKF